MATTYKVIPLAEAAKNAEQYSLDDVVENYDDDNMKDLWTLFTGEDDDVEPRTADITGKVIEETANINMACWFKGSLYNSETVSAVKVEGQWFITVDDDYYPEWM